MLPNYEINLIHSFPLLTSLKAVVFSWNGDSKYSHKFIQSSLPNHKVILYIPASFIENYKTSNYILNEFYDTIHSVNVEYYYNYEESPNDGIYLADHLEEGEEIYLEASPTREGNQFGGWYAEPNCVTELKTGALFHGEDVLKLYAKWNS